MFILEVYTRGSGAHGMAWWVRNMSDRWRFQGSWKGPVVEYRNGCGITGLEMNSSKSWKVDLVLEGSVIEMNDKMCEV